MRITIGAVVLATAALTGLFIANSGSPLETQQSSGTIPDYCLVVACAEYSVVMPTFILDNVEDPPIEPFDPDATVYNRELQEGLPDTIPGPEPERHTCREIDAAVYCASPTEWANGYDPTATTVPATTLVTTSTPTTSSTISTTTTPTTTTIVATETTSVATTVPTSTTAAPTTTSSTTGPNDFDDHT